MQPKELLRVFSSATIQKHWKAARMKPVPTPGQKAELRVLRQLTDAQFKN